MVKILLVFLMMMSFFAAAWAQPYQPQPYQPQPYQPVSAPVYRPYRPGMGGMGGRRMGNVNIPLQKMTYRPVYDVYTPPKPRVSVNTDNLEIVETAAAGETEALNQSGIKMFKPEDEKAVMDFNVENQEFNKLSPQEKQELMQRVIIDKK